MNGGEETALPARRHACDDSEPLNAMILVHLLLGRDGRDAVRRCRHPAVVAATVWTVLAGLAGVTGCGKLASDASSPATRLRRNVVLVTLDTTRADRLGCYGATNHTSP